MNRLILFLSLLGLVTKSEHVFAQKIHYHGVAMMKDSGNSIGGPQGCDCVEGLWINTTIDSAEYIEYYTVSKIDSISYTIFLNIGVMHKKVSFSSKPANITYLKNDGDSIVFNIVEFVDTFWVQCNGAKFCPSAISSLGYFSGIIRIATSTAGLSHQENKNLFFKIFPNPTTGLLKIKSNVKKISLIDLLGNTIAIVEPFVIDENGFTTIDVSAFPSGCYTLLLEAKDNKSFGRFIKY